MKYRGIARDKNRPNRWQVKLRIHGKQIKLGYYADPRVAATVSDFAKYLCHGLHPGRWHHLTARPNFPPLATLPFQRVQILVRLADARVVSIDTLQDRLAEYDKMAS